MQGSYDLLKRNFLHRVLYVVDMGIIFVIKHRKLLFFIFHYVREIVELIIDCSAYLNVISVILFHLFTLYKKGFTL